MAPQVGDKNELVKMAQWVGYNNEYSRWQQNSMAVCIIKWLFLHEYYMNSMVVVVFYVMTVIILNCIMYYCGQWHSFNHKSQWHESAC